MWGYSTTISPVNSLLLAGPKAQIWWYRNPQGQWLIACSLWSTFHRQFPSPHCHQNSNGHLSWLAWHSTPLHSSCGWEGGRRCELQGSIVTTLLHNCEKNAWKIIFPLLHTKSAWSPTLVPFMKHVSLPGSTEITGCVFQWFHSLLNLIPHFSSFDSKFNNTWKQKSGEQVWYFITKNQPGLRHSDPLKSSLLAVILY